VTYGTLSYGFFRDTIQFQRKMMYWHIIPSSTELGYSCPGKSTPASVETFTEGIQIQDHLVLASAAADVARGRGVQVRTASCLH